MTSEQLDDVVDHDMPLADNDYGEEWGPDEEDGYEWDETDSQEECDNEDTPVGPNKEKDKRGGNRRQPAYCWSFMTKFKKLDEKNKLYPYARCHGCEKEFKAHSTKQGTTMLNNHVKVCKKSAGFQGSVCSQTQTTLSLDSFGKLVPHTFDQERLDRGCVEWIICAELSFRIVENPKFHKFVLDLCPRYKVPNRRTIAKGVLQLYLSLKDEMKGLLQGLRVSLTTDTWTSIQNINYMVVTAHFVDESYILHKRIICFKKITSHKGEELGRVLDACLFDWGISRVFSITLDNASSNDKVIEYMNRRLEAKGTLLLRGIYTHIRCACHVINLIVKEGMKEKELGKSIESIRNCVKYIHSSATRLDIFRQYCVIHGLSETSTICLDVVTRWNDYIAV